MAGGRGGHTGRGRVGLANGTIITKLKINPFITTLGMMSIVRGAVLVATKTNYPTGFPRVFQADRLGALLGIPLPVVLLAVATVIADWPSATQDISARSISSAAMRRGSAHRHRRACREDVPFI